MPPVPGGPVDVNCCRLTLTVVCGAAGYRFVAWSDWDGYCLAGGGGSDIEPLVTMAFRRWLRGRRSHYFDWHHTEADTLDKVDPMEFRKNAAMLSVVDVCAG